MTELAIATREQGRGRVVTLSGVLGLDTATSFRDELRRVALPPGGVLVLDLAGVEYCDSSGLSALVAARNQAIAAEADIALARVPRHIAKVLDLTGLDQVLPVHPTVDDAVAARPAHGSQT